MLNSEAALVVTEDEHPTGWGQSDCSTCHSFVALHRRACTPEADLAEVRDIVADDGVASCVDCHGNNGTSN